MEPVSTTYAFTGMENLSDWGKATNGFSGNNFQRYPEFCGNFFDHGKVAKQNARRSNPSQARNIDLGSHVLHKPQEYLTGSLNICDIEIVQLRISLIAIDSENVRCIGSTSMHGCMH